MHKKKKLDLLLIFGFSFLVFLVVAMSLLGASGLLKTKTLFEQTYQTSMRKWVETEQANTNLIAAHRAMKDVALSRMGTQFQAALTDFIEYDTKIRSYFDAMLKTEHDNALLSEAIRAYDDWSAIRTVTMTFVQQGLYDEAYENTRTAGAGQVKLISDKMQLLTEAHKAEAENAYRQAEEMSAVSSRFLLWMMSLAVVLAVLLSIYIRNRLLRYQSLLHEEKEKLQITLDSIGDGVITTDTDRNVLGLNKVAEEMTGWNTRDAYGKPFSQVFHITNAYTGAKAKDPVEEVLSTDLICQLENHTILTSRDGTQRHIADSAAPIKDENGHTSGVVMIFRDVTERKVSEKLLKDSEERFRAIFEQAPIGIGLSDPATGKILEMNNKYAEILSRTREDIIDTDWMSMTHPDDLEKDLELSALLSSGKIPGYQLEKRYIRPDSSVVWIVMSATLVSNTKYDRPLLLCMIEDVTRQKLSETELKVSESRLRTAQAIANVGNWELDLRTSQVWASSQACNIYGLTPHSPFLPLKTVQGVVRREDRPILDEALRALVAENKPYDVTFGINRVNDNALRFIHSHGVTERDSNGKPVKIIGTIQDITDIKNAELALAASNIQLEATLQATADGIEAIDLNGNLIFCNEQYKKMWGLGDDATNPDATFEIISAKLVNPNRSLANIDEFLKQLELEPHKEIPLKDGRVFERYANPIFAGGKLMGYVLSFRDISVRKQREEEILYLNYHDLLTGLYNRAFFEEECARLDCERQLPISVIMGDINGLKLINDAFGHKEGDKLLAEIARILSSSCRKEDILARTGGDEFCILLPQTTEEEARAMCKRILKDCKNYEKKTDKETFYPSISLGYATKTDPTTTIENILAEAEEYMYKQKLLERKSIRSSLISSIKTTMNEKSHLTAEHEERLVALSKMIGRALHLSDGQINELELLSTLHDIGKLSVNDQILNKPGKLTDEEWAEIKKHPDIGYRIAQASPELMPIAEYILCHHERWDGMGYPQGLKGDKIPLLSRIVSVVDAYDAMTQDRPYRKAIPEADAIKEILINAGKQFDPEIARVFVDVLSHR